ncbi:MAG: AraC family transcriptional regulator [Bacteroidota bacterium]
MSINCREIKRYVEFHLAEIKTISDIASPTHVCYETLKKIFSREENISLSDYNVGSKVQAMKEMLVITEESCKYICYSFGLREDTGAKLFKKVTGMTMVEYRQRHRKDVEEQKHRRTPAEK